MPAAYRHCGVSRRAATRPRPVAQPLRWLSRYLDAHRPKGDRHIAKAAGARALVLNFRLAPEHKFPAQIDDVEKAYRWLLARSIRPENIASIGHSIGGNLAVSLALTLRDKGAPLPAAILSVSPWYDPEMKNETWESNASTDMLLTRQAVEGFRERGSAAQVWRGMIPGSICSTPI